MVNRAILRGFKKYFLSILHQKYPEYVKQRICRVNKDKLYENIRSILESNSGSTDYLAKCFFALIRPNSVNFVFKDTCEVAVVTQFTNTIQKYSHLKMSELLNNKFFDVLFSFMFSTSYVDKHHQFFQSNPLMLKNYNVYTATIRNIRKSIKSHQ